MHRKFLLLGAIAGLLLPVATATAGSISAGTFVNIPLTGDASTAPSVDLSAQGTTDWAIYSFGPFNGGNTNIASPHAPDERMAGGSGALGPAVNRFISDGSPAGGFTSVAPFANDNTGGYEGALNFEWSNGTNAATGSAHSALVVRGNPNSALGKPANESLDIDVQASDSLQRLWVYPTSFSTGVNLALSINDGTTAPLFLTDLFGGATTTDSIGRIAVDFVADTPGSVLTLSLTEGSNIVSGATAPSNFRSFGIGALALGEVPEPTALAGLCCVLAACGGLRTRSKQ